MLKSVQLLTLATRFLVEIAALVAYAWWGWRLPTALPVRLLAAIGTPVVAAVVWGVLAAPKAPVHLAPPLWWPSRSSSSGVRLLLSRARGGRRRPLSWVSSPWSTASCSRGGAYEGLATPVRRHSSYVVTSQRSSTVSSAA